MFNWTLKDSRDFLFYSFFNLHFRRRGVEVGCEGTQKYVILVEIRKLPPQSSPR